MEKVKEYILSQVANHDISKEKAKELLLEISDAGGISGGEIAIIGIAGRFSEADNLDQFWDLLKTGQNTIRKYPKERIEDLREVFKNPFATEFLLGTALDLDKLDESIADCGYLNQIDKFDAEFFGIVPNEATYMDPNQRIALEVAWEAIENSGYGGDLLRGTKTGVYIGRDHTNYSFYKLCSERNSLQLTGSWEGMVASRITYFLDLKGPSMVIDTACSAGMVSVHQAVKDLLIGECDVAIAGGINLCPTGEIKAKYKNGATLSSVEADDNTIRTFDSRATGTVWGEGAGMLIMKPLSKAKKDGDHIHAIIKASAINNDGMTNSLTAPSAKTQEQVILEAWKKGKIDPETISYFEAHGTGTVLGDPIEISGITNAFRNYTKKKQFCGIGSLKTTMGHMVGASGIASIAKVVKAFEHKQLPANANFLEPNPYIDFANSPLYVNNELTDWEPECGIRRADINSFGFIRTNCHMVLEEPPRYEAKEDKQRKYVLTISAKNEDCLYEYIRKYSEYLENCDYSLSDICYTSNVGRGHYSYRCVIPVSNKNELREIIRRIDGQTMDRWGAYGVQCDYFVVVNNKKKELGAHECTDAQINELTTEAMNKLSYYVKEHQQDEMLLRDICNLYVRGAKIDWSLLYGEEKVDKVPVPTYPFKKTRYWANSMKSELQLGTDKVIHPMVEKKTAEFDNHIVFETVFSNNKQWVLSDHKINNISVLPGTSYLEMVKEAMYVVENTRKIRFENLFFLQPMVMEDGEERKVYTVLEREGDKYSFRIYSGKNKNKIVYTEGDVAVDTSESENVSFKDIQENADEKELEVEQINDTGVFQFGRHWEVVRAYWRKGNKYLLKLELPKDLQNDLSVFTLHPGIMDNAVNFTSQSTGETFLPFTYKTLKIYSEFKNVMYSQIEVSQQNSETAVYNVDIFDEAGNLIVQVKDYTTKKVHAESFRQFNSPKVFSKFIWKKADNRKSKKQVPGKWAVILKDSQRGTELLEELKNQGKEAVAYYLADSADEGKNVFCADENGVAKIVSKLQSDKCTGLLFAPDYTGDSQEILSNPEPIINSGLYTLFRLTKELIKMNVKLPNGVIVLVADAWEVDKKEPGIAPNSAATAGLARVMGQEYLHFHVEIVDATENISVENVVSEIMDYSLVGYRAIREDGVYCEQMVESEAILNDAYEPEDDGVYVLTGGLGGIALAIAEEMVRHKKVNLLLVGRSAMLPREEWEKASKDSENENNRKYSALLRISEKAGSIDYFRADVSDKEAMERLGDHIRKNYSRVIAVYHTAGVPADGYLKSKDESIFLNVTRPKIEGTINILNQLRKEDRTKLVLFSSIVSLQGGEGEGDYCAANSFLDAMVPYATGMGFKTVSVNWPGWLEVGISHRLGLKDEYTLFKQITVKEGISWMFYLLKHPEIRCVPAHINDEFLAKNIDELVFEVSDKIKQKALSAKKKSGNEKAGSGTVKAIGIADMNEIQSNICNIYATVLGLDEIDVYKSFQDLGGNSLMTTSLLKLVNQFYEGLVDIADLFSYATVVDLAQIIEERLQEKEAQKAEDDGKVETLDLMDRLKSELGEDSDLLNVLNENIG